MRLLGEGALTSAAPEVGSRFPPSSIHPAQLRVVLDHGGGEAWPSRTASRRHAPSTGLCSTPSRSFLTATPDGIPGGGSTLTVPALRRLSSCRFGVILNGLEHPPVVVGAQKTHSAAARDSVLCASRGAWRRGGAGTASPVSPTVMAPAACEPPPPEADRWTRLQPLIPFQPGTLLLQGLVRPEAPAGAGRTRREPRDPAPVPAARRQCTASARRTARLAAGARHGTRGRTRR